MLEKQPQLNQTPLMSISQNTSTSSSLVKNEPDIDYIEQLKQVPQPVPPPPSEATSDQPMDEPVDEVNKNGKRPFNKKLNTRRLKKQKVQKRPVYFEGCQPAMILNEYHKNLEFKYDVETVQTNKPKFICTVHISVKDPATDEVKDHQFKGEGMSKKDAKKECCNQALTCLFPDSYHAPEKVTLLEEKKDELFDQKSKHLKRLADLRRRISKLVTFKTVQIKAPSQILHELSVKIAETGKCIQENGQILDQKFCYQIDNVQDESIASIDINTPSSVNAFGFGKSKKDAKNQASRNALKFFFDCDLDKIIFEANLTQFNQFGQQQQPLPTPQPPQQQQQQL